MLQPVDINMVLYDQVYEALKEAITSMDIYSDSEPSKLDERRLAEDLGVSRTPIREAISRLEQEGFVKCIPRRGAFVVRKTKKEILEIICVWAALEGMAVRLATVHASDEEISNLRNLFVTFEGPEGAEAHIDEYSHTNIRFHQTLMGLSKCDLISEITEGLFIHMRAIRARTIMERQRAAQSIIDHMHIVEALEQRDADMAERLVREHSLNLAEHVKQYVEYLN